MNETQPYIRSGPDRVHDYERKGPLHDVQVHNMFRQQPAAPHVAKDYQPDNALDLMNALRKGKSVIIPTGDVKISLKYLSHARYDVRFNIVAAEDEGWSRIKAEKEGKLAAELLQSL